VNATASGWSSLTSADLLISLRVPTGWEVTVLDENRFRVQRPGEDDDGYRATLSVEAGRPEQPGREWFDSFADAVADQLAREVPGLELLGIDRYTLSSQAPVVSVRARRTPGPELAVPATSQVQAWVWGGSYRLISLGASTLRRHEERDLPVFDTIVRSLRLLPRRPSAPTA
jgi:hypothetical protein